MLNNQNLLTLIYSFLLAAIMLLLFRSLASAACDSPSICPAPPGGCVTLEVGLQIGDFTKCYTEYNVCIEKDKIHNNCIAWGNQEHCSVEEGTCSEVTWTSCCSPGTDCGDGICNRNGGEDENNCGIDCGGPLVCGDEVCSGSESCSSCPADCGACNYCGDGNCVDGESCESCPGDCGTCPAVCGNGACENGEGCDACVADCGVCAASTYCGDGSCNGSENCSSCAWDCGQCAASCGDSVCNGGETCSSCSVDCGACPPAACGDGVCTGLESCSSCSTDCGICLSSTSWLQVVGGSLHAGAKSGHAVIVNLPFQTCLEPGCKPYLLTNDLVETSDSVGVVTTGGGTVQTGGYTTEGELDQQAFGTTTTRVRENYAYFYRLYSLGLSPEENFAGSAGDTQKPSFSQEAYFHQGDMTIQSPWSVASNESYVVFVDGNLSFADPSGVEQLVSVAEGGFLMFVVSGDITIEPSVGNSVLSNTTPNLEGIFVADGILTTAGSGSENDQRFIGAGVFAGLTQVSLNRHLGDTNNQTIPAETFTYRPDLVTNLPDKIKRAQILWQERN